MFDAKSVLWSWVADQPAYIEVAVGMAFVLILAPAILAVVALLLTQLESIAGSIGSRLLVAAVGQQRDMQSTMVPKYRRVKPHSADLQA